jgi:hypothetical protein
MEAHRRVVWCCLLQPSERLHGLAGKVYVLDRFPISVFQVANNVTDARAFPLFEFRLVAYRSFNRLLKN